MHSKKLVFKNFLFFYSKKGKSTIWDFFKPNEKNVFEKVFFPTKTKQYILRKY